MGDLKFDEGNVNTELAEEFLLKNDYTFLVSLTNEKDALDCKEDAYNNKIYFNCGNVYPKETQLEIRNSEVFNKLAKKLEDNAELFAQLDYLIRGNSMDDVKNDMKILIKQLLNFPGYQAHLNPNNDNISAVSVREHKSMLQFLYIIQALMSNNTLVWIVTDVNTAVISFLFTELCKEAGLNMGFALVRDDDVLNDIDEEPGCVGVVTATSDIDSAVDAFLSSFKKMDYPWTLRRVLVQENVYESFKSSLKWKCDKSPRNNKEVDVEIRTACTDVFLYGKNQFLLDFVGTESPSNGIRVESYRTVKELLGILKKNKELRFLSLWCSDISEANEIAYGTSMSVWINDIGHIDGPAKLLYALELHAQNYDEVGDSWKKLSETERRKILLSLIDEPLFKENYSQDIDDLRRKLQQNSSNTVNIQNNRLYVFIDKSMFFPHVDECLNNLHCLLNGTVTFFIEDLGKFESLELFEKFRLPIRRVYNIILPGTVAKFVITNFGTTFAN